MEQTFNKICVYPHSGKIQDPDDQIHEVIGAIRVFGDGYTPIVKKSAADKRTLFVSVGGDGTMLKAAKEAVKHRAATLCVVYFQSLAFAELVDVLDPSTPWAGRFCNQHHVRLRRSLLRLYSSSCKDRCYTYNRRTSERI